MMKLRPFAHLAARSLATLSVLSFSSTAYAGITIGLHFVEDSDEPIDFMTIPGFPAGNLIQPWQMTAQDTEFVADGAFQGITEQEARTAIVAAIKNRYYSIPTPQGYVLDIDFQDSEVSGPDTVNVLIGKHNQSSQNWFGFAKEGGALGPVDGESNAAISLDRINSLLQLEFTHFDDAVNAISNTITHEVGHLVGLDHVWADERADLGWKEGDPIVTNPYDAMATAQSGLPEAGWIQPNVFTLVPGTQAGGQSSVGRLIETVGLRRIGDLNGDSDVDNQDILKVAGSFTGSGSNDKEWLDGDMDYDGDVDNADLVQVAGAFTGSAAGNLVNGPNNADLIYDPATGNVKIDAAESAGGIITGFQLENFDGSFNSVNYLSPGGGFGGVFEDISTNVIADSDLTFSGFSGIHDFGNILPTGLDALGLATYLKTAAYGGSLGSGSQVLDLILVGEAPFVLNLGIVTSQSGPGYDLTWTNREFKNYDIESSTDLRNWEPFDPDGVEGPLEALQAIPFSSTETNTLTITLPSNPGRFFRVVENNENFYSENFDGAEFTTGFPADWIAEANFTVNPGFPNPESPLPVVATAWEVGQPSGSPSTGYSEYLSERDGPVGSASGQNSLGTNIIDGYCGRAWRLDLTSPTISVERTLVPISINFQQWISTAGGNVNDQGRVQILDALNDDSVVAELTDINDNGESPSWSKNELIIPLETMAGLTLDEETGYASIKLRFTFFSSSEFSMTTVDPIAGFREPSAGFYIDDLKVEYSLPN